jgi:hypothetical protein
MDDSGTPIPVPLLAGPKVALDFAGGDLSSDAGLIPLALADQKLPRTRRLADAVADPRDPRRIQHSLPDLFRERISLIALGDEDGNDATTRRPDPLVKLAVGRAPDAQPLASQSTLSRLENAVTLKDLERLGHVLLEPFLARCGPAPQRIVLDLDPFADECHGNQQGVLFNGYYDGHCSLPLSRCGAMDDGPASGIGALRRPGGAPPPKGARFLLKFVSRAIRKRYPAVEIIVRGDGGFGVPKMIRICHPLDRRFCFGKPPNARLHALSEREQLRAAVASSVTKRSHQEFGEFEYRADSWKQAERTIVKAEVTQGKLNPRFVVTDLAAPAAGTPERDAEWTAEPG